VVNVRSGIGHSSSCPANRRLLIGLSLALITCGAVCLACSPAKIPVAQVPTVAPSATPTPKPTPTDAWWTLRHGDKETRGHGDGETRGHGDKSPSLPVTPSPRLPVSEVTPSPRLPVSETATPTPVNLSGKILFLTDRVNGWREGWEGPEIWMMDGDGSNQRPCPDPSAYERALEAQRWSPDHAYRVFVGQDAQIHVEFPQDGTSWEVSRTGSGIAYDPAWSPVDDRIVFVSTESGQGDEIYVIRASGEGLRRLTFNEHIWDKFPTWSPDGRRIAFWSNRTGNKQIWVMNADGSHQRNLSRNGYNDWEPVWIR